MVHLEPAVHQELREQPVLQVLVVLQVRQEPQVQVARQEQVGLAELMVLAAPRELQELVEHLERQVLRVRAGCGCLVGGDRLHGRRHPRAGVGRRVPSAQHAEPP